MSRTVGKLESI